MSTGTPSRRTESSGGGIVFVAAGCTSTCDIGTMVHCTSSRGKRLQYSVLCEKHCPPGSYPVEYEDMFTMDEVVALADKCHMTFNEVPPLVQAPPPLSNSFERHNKEDAMKQLTSRYNKDQSLTFDK